MASNNKKFVLSFLIVHVSLISPDIVLQLFLIDQNFGRIEEVKQFKKRSHNGEKHSISEI